MTQPTQYTRSTEFAEEERNNTGGRSTVRTAQIDAELDAVGLTANETATNLGLIQRDDGEIRDAMVKLHTLAPDVLKIMALRTGSVRGAWLTATAYAVWDLVTQAGATYVCAVAHTAGTFSTDLAAVKWVLIQNPGSVGASGIPFTPTATLAATDVQAAIEESDSEVRALVAAITTGSEEYTDDSIAALQALFEGYATAAQGAGLSGFDYRLPYALSSAGWGIKEVPGLVNVLLMIPPAQHAAIKAGTSTYNAAAEIQAALTGNAAFLPGGVYKTGSKLTLGYSLTGSGMESSQIVATANTFDILEVADGVDFMKVEDLRLQFPSNGTGRGLVLKNNNNDVTVARVSVLYGAVGIEAQNIAFRQRYEECRVDYATTGFKCEGQSSGGIGAGTTLTYDRCYISNNVVYGWVCSNMRSVDFLQPAADVFGCGTVINCTGVGHLNIHGGHFEGSPGADGEYIKYATSGNLSHGMNVTGLCIEAPTFATGRTFRLLNIQANDDHVRVILNGVNIRSMAGDLTNVKLAKISGAVGSKVTIIAIGCDFGAIDGLFDTSAMSGSWSYRKVDSEPAIVAAGSTSVNASAGSGVIATGVDFTDPPKRVFVQHRRDDGVLPTVIAHVTQTYSTGGDVQVRFTKLTNGDVDTGTYDVDWQVIAAP